MEMISFSSYTAEINKAYEKINHDCINSLVDLFWEGYHSEKMIFLFGNGGSGSAASHFCEDIGKDTLIDLDGFKRFKVLSLTDNLPYILAWANDHGYETIFEQQLKNFAKQGDIAVGISGSGNSENVVRAIEYANSIGMKTVGFTGFDSGKLGKMVSHHIHVPSNNMGIIESVHASIMHFVVQVLRERMKILFDGDGSTIR
jgi:D-sedoheptulose 7-phosphate isomerase